MAAADDLEARSRAATSAKARRQCAVCREMILPTDDQINAFDLVFHSKHFNCVQCQRNMVGVEHLEHKQRPLCHDCFKETAPLPTCSYCHELIEGVIFSLRVYYVCLFIRDA